MTEHPFGGEISSDLSYNANPINQGLKNWAFSLLCHQRKLAQTFCLPFPLSLVYTN